MRVAAYYVPAVDDPLWRAGCTWLGRDPETAATSLSPFPEFTAEPRLYGFHATLKPPMRLSTAYDTFIETVRSLGSLLRPFPLPPLRVADLSGFLALRESRASPELQNLADTCVLGLDMHRAPPDEAELARRRRGGLPPAQDAMLVRWGYPHVFETWFFHMTLTRRLTDADRAAVRPAAEAHFAAALGHPREVDAITIFTQSAAGAPFLIAERLPLGG